jgi:hypothetical protein
VDVVDQLGSTAMHAAATTDNSKVVMSLLWIGADPYKEDLYGATPQVGGVRVVAAVVEIGGGDF